MQSELSSNDKPQKKKWVAPQIIELNFDPVETGSGSDSEVTLFSPFNYCTAGSAFSAFGIARNAADTNYATDVNTCLVPS